MKLETLAQVPRMSRLCIKVQEDITCSFAGKIFSKRTFLLLFFWLGGLCAGTSGNRTRPRRSRRAGQEKTECIKMNSYLLT